MAGEGEQEWGDQQQTRHKGSQNEDGRSSSRWGRACGDSVRDGAGGMGVCFTRGTARPVTQARRGEGQKSTVTGVWESQLRTVIHSGFIFIFIYLFF